MIENVTAKLKSVIGRKLILGIITFVSILVLAILAAAGINLAFPSSFQNFRIENLSKIGPASQAIFSTEQTGPSHGQLKVDLRIQPKDAPALQQFSDRLGIGTTWTSGISFQLDQASLSKLENYLPKTVDVMVTGSEISFNNGPLLVLNSGLPENMTEYATGSGALTLKSRSETDFELYVTDPGIVLEHASKAGKVTLSSQLEEFLPSLQKVESVYLRVSGDHLDGSIKLK